MHKEHAGKPPSRSCEIREVVTDTVVIPMQMHLGAPSKPCVQAGDYVKLGQLIGEPQGALGVAIHASVSGQVTDVSEKIQLMGTPSLCVTVANDYTDTPHESFRPLGTVDSLTAGEILAAIKSAGICGMGGAAFPTHVKLAVPPEKKVDTVILNGAECELFLTADHRLMLESPRKIVAGLRAVMRALNVPRGAIAIEDNKPDAILSMRKASSNWEDISVYPLKAKYPQGAEKQIIRAVTGREIPQGGLPFDAGVVVLNVATAAAIARAIIEGTPLIRRVTTITGGVKDPGNLLLRIGTIAEDAIAACGGYDGPASSIIVGGPMTGISAPNADFSITKATNGIVVLNKELARLGEEGPCIRCAKCVDACPVGLAPYRIKHFCAGNDLAGAKANHVTDCISCGCCSYVCPARRHLTPAFKVAKEKIALAARRS